VGFRATLNFRKFKVALNPTYKFFLNFAKTAWANLEKMAAFLKRFVWCQQKRLLSNWLIFYPVTQTLTERTLPKSLKQRSYPKE